jgi:hypothetical protein
MFDMSFSAGCVGAWRQLFLHLPDFRMYAGFGLSRFGDVFVNYLIFR